LAVISRRKRISNITIPSCYARKPRSNKCRKPSAPKSGKFCANRASIPSLTETVTAALTRDPDRWVYFMMRFELGLEKPEAGRALKSAFTIGGAYVAGGLIPLAPYFLLDTVSRALPVSIALTLAALLIFGGVKGQLTGVAPFRSALQTAIVGYLPPLPPLPSRGSLAVDLG